jgi:protease-4
VWSGADAVANGLADETGGLRDAIDLARRRGGLPSDAPVRVYPRLGPLEQFRPAESSESRPAAASATDPVGAAAGAAIDAATGQLLAAFADGWGPAWQFAARAGLPPYGPLMLPGIWRIS